MTVEQRCCWYLLGYEWKWTYYYRIFFEEWRKNIRNTSHGQNIMDCGYIRLRTAEMTHFFGLWTHTLWPSVLNILFRSVWSSLFQHTLFFLKGSNPFMNLFDSFMTKTELNYYNNILKMHTAQLTQDAVTSLRTWQPETPSLTVAQNLLWYHVHSSSGANPISYPMDNFPNGYVCLIFVPKLRK
jgi:hypothetical protein